MGGGAANSCSMSVMRYRKVGSGEKFNCLILISRKQIMFQGQAESKIWYIKMNIQYIHSQPYTVKKLKLKKYYAQS